MSKQHGLVILFSLLAATEGTDCPDGWLAFDCSCYLFPKTPARFWEAVHYCQIHGGNLIHVDSDMENYFIKNCLRGVRRPNEGTLMKEYKASHAREVVVKAFKITKIVELKGASFPWTP
ncbi:hypothetical protein DPMN_135085 [Dreissena polymorpha]|uniref:C-type lectin domain-containing protein n=1 Tax=Dreissena polymorpha TaxID=45954 RepID=A0A9D4G094_DREPO|nr:hypothetical protein DPMN_135085 [Dreissena polymorpha]